MEARNMNMEWKEAKVFVSSTFNDMHAERDYLVTEVFPELAEWCEERRIRLTDIDLRWGVTREDSESGNTVRACLNCIDECRPFFLCFLGQRRGWVPDLNADVGADTLRQYRELRRKLGIYSITEMEIEHATLAPMTRLLADGPHTPDKSKAMFFFRNDPFGGSGSGAAGEGVLTEAQRKIYTNAGAEDEEAEDRKLEGSKEWISKEWEPFHYDCVWDPEKVTEELRTLGEVSRGGLRDFEVDGKPLKEVILGGLKKMIEEEFPENQPVAKGRAEDSEAEREDRFDGDALEQQLHWQMAAFDFTGREKEVAGILHHLENDVIKWTGGEGEALFLTAPEGMGKTALLAKCAEMLTESGHRVLARSCGLTDLSNTLEEVYLSLGNEAGLFRASDRDPRLSCRIDSAFLSSLMEKGYDTLIVDGLDHAGDRGMIRALERIPGGFHLILSSDDPEEWRNFKFSYDTMVLTGLVTPEERAAVVDQYLLRTLKKLDMNQLNEIISVDGAEYPMFLRIVINELKTFGSFVELTDKIRRFGDKPQTAFAELIDAVSGEFEETDINIKGGFTGAVMGMLLFARDGLSEDEMMAGLENMGALAGTDPDEVRTLLRRFMRRIRPYIVRINRRYSLQNKALKGAVTERFGALESQCRHALVYVYENNLRAAPPQTVNEWEPVHGSHELLYQLEMLGEWDVIRYALTRPEIFRNLDPDDYRGGYRNGRFFKDYKNILKREDYTAADTPVGFSLDADEPEGRERLRMLAEIFLGKASDNIGVIGRLYPHPYAPRCTALRKKEDQTEFYKYRDLFYEATQFARIAFRYERMSLAGGERSEAEKEWQRFDKLATPVYMFMQYLSQFGGDQTGLSYQIEDLADGALLEYKGVRI